MKIKDVILTICLLLAAGIFYLLIQIMGHTEGNQVIITVNGQEYGRYPLSENKEINVKNENGYNTVIISNGKVRMKDADCPDKYCVNQGEINKNGQTLICLPHKLSVEVNASDKVNGIDAVVE